MVRLMNDGVHNGSVDTTFNAGGSGADDRIWNVQSTSLTAPGSSYGAFQYFNGYPTAMSR